MSRFGSPGAIARLARLIGHGTTNVADLTFFPRDSATIFDEEVTLVASDDRRQEAARIHALLQSACHRLEQVEEHVIAAYVGHAIALLEERYDIASGSEEPTED